MRPSAELSQASYQKNEENGENVENVEKVEPSTELLPSPETENTRVDEKPLDFDKILRFDIGEYGPFQLLVGVSTGLCAAFGTIIIMNFVFGATIPEHRCFVPECEEMDSTDYTADWLKYAIPHQNGQPDSCSRYEYVASVDSSNGTCGTSNFNQSNVVRCDSFVTKNNAETIASHLNLFCTGQESKLALLGTASTFGRLIGMPVSGIMSDKFGRLKTFVVSSLLGVIFSTLQAIPGTFMSFELYWLFEFLAAFLSTATIGVAFVYNMEWMTAKYRIRSTNIFYLVQTCADYGAISLAAWYFANNFIAYKLILAVPGFFAVCLYFTFGESPKWLFTQNKYSQAIRSISIAGRINGKPLQSQTIQQIQNPAALTGNDKFCDDQSNKVTIADVLRNRILAFRLIMASLISLLVMFAYFGTIFGSTNVHSNKYISFLIIGWADIPAAVINTLLMNRVGRKITIGTTLLIYGILLLLSTQVPTIGLYRLILFCISKTSIKTAWIGLNTYVSEFWPTSIRNTMYGIAMMVGRAGSILASVSGLLVNYHPNLPWFSYAAAALLSSVLVCCTLPETMHCGKLPDTIEEALNIGKSDKKHKETC